MDPIFKLLISVGFLFGQCFTRLFFGHQFTGTQPGKFDHTKSNVGLSFGEGGYAHGFFQRGVETCFATFSFYRIVEDGLYTEFGQLIDGVLTILDRFAPTKLLKEGFPDQSFDGKSPLECFSGKNCPCLHHPGILHRTEKQEGSLQLCIRPDGEGSRGIVKRKGAIRHRLIGLIPQI